MALPSSSAPIINDRLCAEDIEDDEFVMRIEEFKKTDKDLLFKPQKKPQLTADDFEILAFLGEGSYAKVVKAKQKPNGKLYALKIILKKHVKKVRRINRIIKIAKEGISSQD